MAIRILRCASPHAEQDLTRLLAQLGAQGDVVSPRGRALTEKVFGEALPPGRVVQRVCDDVRSGGLEALLRYTELFDGTRLTRDTIRVSTPELASAHESADAALLQTIRRVRNNVHAFQSRLLNKDAVLEHPGSHELRLRYRPMRRVGVMIPGGAAAYPS